MDDQNKHIETTDADHIEDPNQATPLEVETDYAANKADPGPAPTVEEADDKGAGPAMKWIIPIAIVVLLIIYFFFFRNNVSN